MLLKVSYFDEDMWEIISHTCSEQDSLRSHKKVLDPYEETHSALPWDDSGHMT